MIKDAIMATPMPTVGGNFDCIQEGYACGWAFTPTNLQKRLEIEILSGNEVVARGVASLARDDVKSANIGDGAYGFQLPLSIELFDGNAHELIAREVHTKAILPNSPLRMGPQASENNYPQLKRQVGLLILADLFKKAPYNALAEKANGFFEAYRLASLLQETGDVEGAFKAWFTINTALGENHLCYYKIGECYLLKNNPEHALIAFRKAAHLENKSYFIHQGIAHAYALLGQFGATETALKTALQLNPQDEYLLRQLNSIQRENLPTYIENLLKNERRDEAIQWLVRLLLAEPENQQVYDLLGSLIYKAPANSLPEMAQINKMKKSQKILDLLLDTIESRTHEGTV